MAKRGYTRQIPDGFEEYLPGGQRRCWGRARSTGKQCSRWAMNGQNVCRTHGGAAPQNIKKAKQRTAEAAVAEETRRALAVLNVAPVENPLTALSEVAGQILAWKDRLSFRVNALNEEIRFTDQKGSEQLRAEVALYERALDRSVAVLGTIGRLNIDERLTAINEKQAEKLISAINALLEHLGITGDAAAEARRFVARKLRSV